MSQDWDLTLVAGSQQQWDLELFYIESAYGAPLLTYAAHASVSVPGDPATIGIPLLLTSYSGPTRKPAVNLVTTMPIIQSSGHAYGGQAVSVGAVGLSQITMEGTIDSPITVMVDEDTGASAMVPALVVSGSTYITYADFMAMCLEGRLNAVAASPFGDDEEQRLARQTNSGRLWTRTDPLSFRDPYGRVFNNPRVLDFTASYVEAVPGRVQFSLTLKV